MTSKSSFLVSMMENNKRRVWVWALSLFGFVLLFPIYIGLQLSAIYGMQSTYMERYGEEGAHILQLRALMAMENSLGFSWFSIFVGGLAVICAMQGFAWLCNRRKIDFYMGMPVKRSKRFLIIWLNGIFIFVLPYLLGLVIGILIAAANGAVDGSVLACAAEAFGGNILLYLCMYNLTLVAVMLTGSSGVAFLGILVFLVYEFFLRYVILEYQMEFFDHFSWLGKQESPLLSPVTLFYDLAEYATRGNAGWLLKAIELLGLALALGAISYICYLKRPAEAAGRAMVFNVTKPAIKFLLVIPAALFAGSFLNDMLGDAGSNGYMIFAYVFTTVIGCALIQVIYEFDIRGALHKKLHIMLCGAAVLIIFCIFRYDILGYDRYIPTPDKVESVAFIPMYGSGDHFDPQGDSMSTSEYAQQYMYLTDAETVCHLVSLAMQEQRATDEMAFADEAPEDYYFSDFTVLYRLKSGREVSRMLFVNVKNEKIQAALEQIMNTEEYRKGMYMGASDIPQDLMAEGNLEIKGSWENTIYKNDLSRQELAELLAAYKQDSVKMGFFNVRDNFPVGEINLTVQHEGPWRYTSSWQRSSWQQDFSLWVYPFFDETIAYLKEHGYYMENYFDPQDVEKIIVSNENQETKKKLLSEWQKTELSEEDIADLEIDTRVYQEYTDPEDIQILAEYCYPRELRGYSVGGGTDFEPELEVRVYFKGTVLTGRDASNYFTYKFLSGQVPEFVMNDTKYVP